MRRSPFFFLVLWFWLPLLSQAVAQTATETTLYVPLSDADLGPASGLAQGLDGKLYGSINGNAYALTTAGALTSLASEPFGSALVQGPSGNFYGTTTFGGGSSDCNSNPEAAGGNTGCGTIFEVYPSGDATVLYAFATDGNGSAPVAPLVLGSDGNFYGTTTGDNEFEAADAGKCGPSTCGTIFRISPGGAYEVLYVFTGQTDGGYPTGPLLQASDGNFYGTTTIGGNLQCSAYNEDYGCGTVFQFTPAGKLTTLHAFSGPDGFSPLAGLVEGSDGSLYGSTPATTDPDICDRSNFGAQCGTIFKISAAVFKTLFIPVYGEGTNYAGGLFPDSAGTLYGAAEDLGTYPDGTVFQMTDAGVVSRLFAFAGTAYVGGPNAAPLQGSDGNLYGPAYGIYELTLSPVQAAPVQITASATSVTPNMPVTITWSVLNAFSVTMQQCYAFLTFNGELTPLGQWQGTYNSASQTYRGSTTVTPAEQGYYRYALTCGGVESNSVAIIATGNQLVSTTALAANPNFAAVGQVVTLAATVSGTGPIPTGTVSFSYSGQVFAQARLGPKGVARVSASSNALPVGAYAINASYSGDADYTPSGTSGSVSLGYASTTTLTASPNPVLAPNSVTLTASVLEPVAISYPQLGVVKFYSGNVLIGSANFSSDCVGEECSASFTAATTGIPAGTYPVTAVFQGYGAYAPSTSAVINVIVRQ